MGNLLVNPGKHLILQASGSHHQHRAVLQGLSQCQRLKHSCCIQADFRVGGHEREVGIEPRRLFIIVPGTDLGVILHLFLSPAGDQTELGVHLIAVQSIHHLAASILQPAGPLNVVLLVKAGLELHQDKDLLAVFRRLN